MKKFILSALCALGLMLSGTTAQAQDTFSKGSSVLNLGIGLPSSFHGLVFPPVTASYERSMTDGIFDKGSVGLGADSEFYLFQGGYSLFLGVRGSAHYEFIPKLDTYLGLSLGLGHTFVKGLDPDFGFHTKGHLGARYLLNDDLGVFGEFGLNGFGYVRAGISLSL